MVSTFQSDVGFGGISVETGKLAQQANGSVVLRFGDNVLLVTATMDKPREGIDFFPLTVEFEERMYARGKIPGSFFRREGRPSTLAILTARLTDRPIRPLFPKGFRNEVQIIVTPLSVDQEIPLDIFSITGASLALGISDIPFEGPIAATRMGYIGGEYVVNPTYAQLEESELDIIVAGSRGGVVMMEAGAEQADESLVMRAIERAQEVNLRLIQWQEEIINAVGKPKAAYEADSYAGELDELVETTLNGRLTSIFDGALDKTGQSQQLKALQDEVMERYSEQYEPKDIMAAFEALLEKEFRKSVLDHGKRPDGRGLREIRPISSEVGVLPRTHGSGLFTRGETQVLCTATLGSVGDAQRVENLSPEEIRRFMLHYNFPPYSTGEARRVGSPGRREIGHGALAERSLLPVLPDEETFPYTIRLVCEVLSSNGSTSMASVCSGTLALMDAGVPIRAPVAGISIGLVTGEGGRYATLTDIQGLEDHIGDMDFKVAGTSDGITGIQVDIKVKSLSFDIIRDAFTQAKEARLFILDRLRETIASVRPELSRYAPRMLRITIPVEKIGTVIGPGGKTIRGIIEATGATVDIQDDGTVIIGSTEEAAASKAVQMVEDLTREVKAGDIYTGRVTRLMNFGAFVEVLPGKEGLVHISELADRRVEKVEDVVEVGQEITVMVTEIDSMGRINLSRRALLRGEGEEGEEREPVAPRERRGGRPGGERPGWRGGPPRRGGDRGPRGGGPRPRDRR